MDLNSFTIIYNTVLEDENFNSSTRFKFNSYKTNIFDLNDLVKDFTRKFWQRDFLLSTLALIVIDIIIVGLYITVHSYYAGIGIVAFMLKVMGVLVLGFNLFIIKRLWSNFRNLKTLMLHIKGVNDPVQYPMLRDLITEIDEGCREIEVEYYFKHYQLFLTKNFLIYYSSFDLKFEIICMDKVMHIDSYEKKALVQSQKRVNKFKLYYRDLYGKVKVCKFKMYSEDNRDIMLDYFNSDRTNIYV
jgi:hypothetical protein